MGGNWSMTKLGTKWQNKFVPLITFIVAINNCPFTSLSSVSISWNEYITFQPIKLKSSTAYFLMGDTVLDISPLAVTQTQPNFLQSKHKILLCFTKVCPSLRQCEDSLKSIQIMKESWGLDISCSVNLEIKWCSFLLYRNSSAYLQALLTLKAMNVKEPDFIMVVVTSVKAFTLIRFSSVSQSEWSLHASQRSFQWGWKCCLKSQAVDIPSYCQNTSPEMFSFNLFIPHMAFKVLFPYTPGAEESKMLPAEPVHRNG